MGWGEARDEAEHTIMHSRAPTPRITGSQVSIMRNPGISEWDHSHVYPRAKKNKKIKKKLEHRLLFLPLWQQHVERGVCVLQPCDGSLSLFSQIERRLDTVRSVCHLSHKRLTACFQGQHGSDAERRYKKLPLTALAQIMQEASTQLEDSLLGKMLETCGDAENQLALELTQHESFVEKEIVDPLCNIAELEIPNIQKQRKQLAKLVLDWDSVRARWNQAHKSSGTNFQGLPSKIDTLKEEMDEAGNKVELCKDQLAADMYSFMSKEGEYGKFFVTLLEAQADYHRKALAVLEKALPEMRAHQGNVTCVLADAPFLSLCHLRLCSSSPDSFACISSG
ncbi:rho GTPase-activating protein 17-like isoform 1-T1 [Lycaon pictus]